MLQKDFILRQFEELGKMLTALLDSKSKNNHALVLDRINEDQKSLDFFNELGLKSLEDLKNRVEQSEHDLMFIERYCFIVIEKVESEIIKFDKIQSMDEFEKIEKLLTYIDSISQTFSNDRIRYMHKIEDIKFLMD